jgi:hypothetical protein
MNTKNIIIVVVIAVVVGASSFFGGMKYSQSQRSTIGGANFRNGNRTPGQGRFSQNGERPVMGEILSQDDKSMTVKMQDGSTKIVILSESTSINKAAEGTKQDLLVGSRVLVVGKTNSDGSVTAQNIQLNPQLRIFGAQPSPTK